MLTADADSSLQSAAEALRAYVAQAEAAAPGAAGTEEGSAAGEEVLGASDLPRLLSAGKYDEYRAATAIQASARSYLVRRPGKYRPLAI